MHIHTREKVLDMANRIQNGVIVSWYWDNKITSSKLVSLRETDIKKEPIGCKVNSDMASANNFFRVPRCLVRHYIFLPK